MIYLVHHADAVGPDVDPQRPLSAAGARMPWRLAGRGRAVAACGRTSSGTAASCARARRRKRSARRAIPLAEFAAIRGLQPTDPPEWIRDRLAGETREVMLVGHFPSLPRILQLLVTGRADGEANAFPLHGLVQLRAEAIAG